MRNPPGAPKPQNVVSRVIIPSMAVLATASAALASYAVYGAPYQAAKDVEADISEILVTLRSVSTKAASISLSNYHYIDLTPEEERISEFLMSTTMYGMYVWLQENDADLNDEWRVFSLSLIELQQYIGIRNYQMRTDIQNGTKGIVDIGADAINLAKKARKIERLIFDTLSDRRHMNEIKRAASRLSSGLEQYEESSKSDTLGRALDDD
ncbi:MAG: hypothetical protein OXQ31_02645 [Spirochaetaceae bacterium]|nr:hypothetical protein [Spirochaetaceae bacterium]